MAKKRMSIIALLTLVFAVLAWLYIGAFEGEEMVQASSIADK